MKGRGVRWKELLRNLSTDARILREVQERVRGYMEGFPELSDAEVEAQKTREAVVLGTLECLVADDLEPALKKLEALTQPGKQEWDR